MGISGKAASRSTFLDGYRVLTRIFVCNENNCPKFGQKAIVEDSYPLECLVSMALKGAFAPFSSSSFVFGRFRASLLNTWLERKMAG